MDKEEQTRLLENGHVAIWLVKDFCWCSGFKELGIAMAGPTIMLAAYLVYRARNCSRDMIHNLAVLFWLCANTTWMAGEFWFNDGSRPQAKVFFIAGLAVLLIFYLWSIYNRMFKKEKQNGT
jgi:hypothetical protein